MSTHIYHAKMVERLATKARGFGVLVDGCERCEEHAERPVSSLDQEHLAALWREMIEVEATDDYDGMPGYRSLADARAALALMPIRRFLDRYTTVDPKAIFADLAPSSLSSSPRLT